MPGQVDRMTVTRFGMPQSPVRAADPLPARETCLVVYEVSWARAGLRLWQCWRRNRVVKKAALILLSRKSKSTVRSLLLIKYA